MKVEKSQSRDVKKLLAKKQKNFKDIYIKDIEEGTFEGIRFYGLDCDNQGFLTASPVRKPGSVYVGGMGSGKSVAMKMTLGTDILANSKHTEYFLVDPMRGLTDYRVFYNYENVHSLINNMELLYRLIDYLYDELLARRILFNETQSTNIINYNNHSENEISTIFVLIEDFHTVCQSEGVRFNINKDIVGTVAYKLKEIVRTGRSYGMTLNITMQRSTIDDLPEEILPGLSNQLVFRMYRPEDSARFNLPQANDISYEERGKAAYQDGFVQFPYLDDDSFLKLLDKYYKQCETRCLVDKRQYNI